MAVEGVGLIFLALCISQSAIAAAAPVTIQPGLGAPVAPGGTASYQSLYPNTAAGINEGNCKFVNIGKANAVGIHSIQIPGSSQNMFIEIPNGGHPLKNDGQSSVIFDYHLLSSWKTIRTDEAVWSAGHTLTSNGAIIHVGGTVPYNITTGGQTVTYKDGLTGQRLFYPTSDYLARTSTMKQKRWRPTLTALPNTNIMITGGVDGGSLGRKAVKFYELYDPNQQNTQNHTAFDVPLPWTQSYSEATCYPFVWLLPTGHVFMYGDEVSAIVNPRTGMYVLNATEQLLSPPPRPGGWSSTYPFSGSAVMTMLKPDGNNTINSVDIVVFGGSRKADHPNFLSSSWRAYNRDAVASRYSHRLTISWIQAGPNAPYKFAFSDWVEEDMGYPRVSNDATLLPNGDVVILNGAQTGVGAYSNGTESRYKDPAFWATLYQPDAAVNSRYTLLCGTEIPRPFQGSATLTVDGNVLVAGADRNDYIPPSGVPWFNGTQNAAPLYDVEIFQTPYSLDSLNKPTISSIMGSTQGIPQVFYNREFFIQYTGPVPTSVVFVAPSATTTGWNQNQRVIECKITGSAAGQINVLPPKHPNYAPPQHYMVFLLNGKTFSTAQWVQLVDADNLGAAVANP